MPNPKMSALIDSQAEGFFDTSIWQLNGGGPPSVTGGQMLVTSPATRFASVVTAFDLTSSYFFFKVSATDNFTTSSMNGPLIEPTGGGSALRWLISSGVIEANCTSDGYSVSASYDPVNHAFLRIREDSGTVYWETSPDGVTWTGFGSDADASVGFDLTSVFIENWLPPPGFGQTVYLSNFNYLAATGPSAITACWP
jgi:hypothetical protein